MANLSSGHDLTDRGFEPVSGSVLTAQSLEPASDSVSPSLCLSPAYAPSLSLKSGKTIKKKKKNLPGICFAISLSVLMF